ncbi:HAD family hydrolase [Alkalicoccobacillus murimartini]|uniref:HAD superfamily hydrolase (TIGR01509 family) n=1 Tax=Alkalicoccobacillus murimartini TaxID=171685 RepID=A0ABT9YMU8_9BACI|nr:HAD family phosphatase [Alkalicoccobacillus murimartini]MDQ0209197.1 HAD superfamily hydrolase (TIGR01509 family) [Alkalicoccobacillus murimartini]
MMKAFIFDMDGVIINSEPHHIEVEIETAARFGATITEEDLSKYMGMVSPEMWSSVKSEHGLTAELEEILDHQIAEKLKRLKESDLEPIKGIPGLMQRLSEKGIPMAVASSSPRIYIEAVLEKFGISDQFVSIISGEEVNQGKPAPDIYLETAQVLGVEPKECVVLEDSYNGVRSAKAAGMTCIGYLAPDAGSQDLGQADTIVRSIEDIQLDEL